MDREMLKDNLAWVRRRIESAARRAGRKPSDITLIAVTKSVDAETTQLLIDLGVGDIAENRAQSAETKLPKVPGAGGVRKHFIGPLQRNKVNKVLEWADCIHSVDSLKLAEAISGRAARPVDVFVQVNVAGEDRKGGIEPGDLGEALPRIMALANLNVLGLMCMAPYSDDPEAARPVFRDLTAVSIGWRARGLPPALSMGMSGDFEIAIEEGATHVRVGSALFEGPE